MLVTHFHFGGHCDEAIKLYEIAFGTKIDFIDRNDTGGVIHAEMHIHGQRVMMNDNYGSKGINSDNISIQMVPIFKTKEQLLQCYEVLKLNKNQPRISGVHVVKAMQEDKYSISSMGLWDMFHKYFWAESSDFIPTETATAFDAIDIIKRTGGIPVIAHPKSIGNDNVVVDLIEYGALGLEVFHPIHASGDIMKYQQIADSKGIYITGGTDWHGKNNGAEVTCFGMCGLENDKYPILSIIQ